jgi:rubrerythrin
MAHAGSAINTCSGVLLAVAICTSAFGADGASVSANQPAQVRQPSEERRASAADLTREAHVRAGRDATLMGRFAAKAREEGFAHAAGLFRAIERSRRVHEQRYAEALREVGLTPRPEPDPEPPAARTTRENLLEVRTILERGRAADQAGAIAARQEQAVTLRRAFEWSRESLTDHIVLLTRAAALSEEDARKGKAFWVSRTCGYTVDTLDFQRCPVCLRERADFEKFE